MGTRLVLSELFFFSYICTVKKKRETRELTLNAGENDPGMVVGNDIGVAILWFIHLQVGVLPCELLPGVDRLQETGKEVSQLRCGVSYIRVFLNFFPPRPSKQH